MILELFGGGLFKLQAATTNSVRDCDSNAVIRCGALTSAELNSRFSQAGVAQIYSAFGISSNDIANISNTAVDGVVTNNNNVWIHRSSGLCPSAQPTSQLEKNNPNLCLVGTNAMTAGRQNIAGSTAVTRDGITFYKRSPSVSFASSSLSAFVVMNNGRFSFAILQSCGNPVTATPVVAAKPATTRPSPAPAPPAPTQTQSQSQTVTVTTTPLVEAAQTTRPPQPTKTLPNTGPGNVLAIGGISALFATTGHYLFQRRKLRL